MKHLSLSESLLFLFDPTQHAKFRAKCREISKDPQFLEELYQPTPQHQVLNEVAARVRAQTGWPQDAKYTKPLIVIVTKYDAWYPLFGPQRIGIDEVVRRVGSGISALHLDSLQFVSQKLENLLRKLSPEIVTAAESFSDHVLYVPVSALGATPIIDREISEAPLVRPKDVNPMWAEIPLLYTLHHATERLIYAATRKESQQNDQVSKSEDSGQPAVQKFREMGA